MKQSKIAWIGLALALVLVLSAAGCRRPIDREPISNLDNSITNTVDESNDENNGPDFTPYPGTNPPESGLADPDIIQSQLTRETQEATEFIRLIQPDAVLTLVSAKYINSLSNTFGLATNYYIFSSPSQPDYYYLVNVPRNGLDPMKRFLMPVSDFDLDFDVLPVPFEYWKVNYAAALKLAEAQGGAAFRAQHKTFEVSVILAIPAGQHLNWFVTYKATDGSGARLQVQVHANTGEVQII